MDKWSRRFFGVHFAASHMLARIAVHADKRLFWNAVFL
jgi:hypothetical protein